MILPKKKIEENRSDDSKSTKIDCSQDQKNKRKRKILREFCVILFEWENVRSLRPRLPAVKAQLNALDKIHKPIAFRRFCCLLFVEPDAILSVSLSVQRLSWRSPHRIRPHARMHTYTYGRVRSHDRMHASQVNEHTRRAHRNEINLCEWNWEFRAKGPSTSWVCVRVCECAYGTTQTDGPMC